MVLPVVLGNPENTIAAKKTVLVLEDDPSVMQVLRVMLAQHMLIEASTAEQALRLFAKHGPQVDLLVADLTLPTSSGLQVALILRSKVPQLPVILTSGYPVSAWGCRDSADLERLGSASVTILEKPFQARRLANAVRGLLGSAASQSAGAL
jgi:DNA-binding NtrC family response regulator